METPSTANEHEIEIKLPAYNQPVRAHKGHGRRKVTKQVMGQCERCGYLSSQKICKACSLLEGLNKSRPRTSIEIGIEDEEGSTTLMRQVGGLAISAVE